jgi:hypothetical protein
LRDAWQLFSLVRNHLFWRLLKKTDVCRFRADREVTAVRLVDQIRLRAYALAQSGRHSDCEAVQHALEREGYAEAHMALRDPYVRARIGGLCSKHRRVRPEASTYLAPSSLPDS